MATTEDRIAAVIRAALAIPIEEARDAAARARRVRDFTPLFDPSQYLRVGLAHAAATAAAEAFLEFRLGPSVHRAEDPGSPATARRG